MQNLENQRNGVEIIQVENQPRQIGGGDEINGDVNRQNQNSLLRPNEAQLILESLDNAIRIVEESQNRMDNTRDSLRPAQYNFVNNIIDQFLNGANRFGYRKTLLASLFSTAVPIIFIGAHCSNLYPDVSANGMLPTAENIEKLNSLQRNMTQMRHNCIEEELPFVAPAAFFISALTLLTFQGFRSRRETREIAQEMPENRENQQQAQGDQPRQAPSVLSDVVVLVERNPNSNSPRQV